MKMDRVSYYRRVSLSKAQSISDGGKHSLFYCKMKRETVNDTNTDAGEVRLDEVSSQVSMTEARPAAHSEEYPLLSAIRYYSPEEVYGDDQPAKRTRNSFSSASTHPRTGEE
jgi:hypothetical protein